MSNFVNITQEQWEELTEMPCTAAQRLEQWAKEREGLAATLATAQEALQSAQTDTQAADQRTCELLGLHTWAGAGAAGGGGTGSNAKVEIFQDPGSYSIVAWPASLKNGG